MDRPKICELLGVNPMEEWTMPGVSGRYRITESGNVEYKRGDDWGPLVTGYVETKFIRALNHPGEIEVKRSWTSDDIEDAKAILRIFPKTIRVIKGHNSSCASLDVCPSSLFPSVKNGETVSLSDILGED